MKKTKKMLLFFMGSVLGFSMFTFNAPTVNAETNTDVNIKSVSQKYTEAMEPGWNLGNTFDSFDVNGDKGEQSWGNPIVTKQLIKTIKAQGFNSIRIPLTTIMRTGEGPNYTLDPVFLARYKEVVQWALDEDLYVMINIHHDSWNWAKAIGSETDNGESMIKYKAIWTQLANSFKDSSDKVCFESLNEPQFSDSDVAKQIKILEDINTEFYNIVRKSGGNNATRMLVLPTLNTNDSDDKCESLYNTIIGFDDDNIIATVHYYGYWPFSTNIAGTTTMNDTVVSGIKAAFDRVYNHFTANGIGVVCGEYGLLGFDKSLGAIEHGEILKYFEYVNYYAKQKGITMMLWDNGQHIGRETLTWSDQSLYNIIKASWTTRSSYSESDRVFIQDIDKGKCKDKSKDKYKAVSMKLTLNGNTLKSISNGNKKLKLGKDYTYKDETVTLKPNYVKSLMKPSYGINATLTMKFSAGADWDVYITHYKQPKLSPAEGTTEGFEIPVEFNGSRLMTLEAMYADGTGAGPQNWTTYKEYDYAFSVNYETNKVVMTKKFFDEANDGEITLKLHFQSGEILEYKILKAGSTVKSIDLIPTIQ